MENALRDQGINRLTDAYAENLKIVLRYVALLVSNLAGNAVNPSDHGEFLGEKRMLDPPSGTFDPVLRIVP